MGPTTESGCGRVLGPADSSPRQRGLGLGRKLMLSRARLAQDMRTIPRSRNCPDVGWREACGPLLTFSVPEQIPSLL